MSAPRCCLAFLLPIFLTACGRPGLPLPDGGPPPDGASPGDAANPISDLASARCVGLDESACRATFGCAADTCLECSCTPTYVGCRAESAPPTQCPGLGCGQPACCHSAKDCRMGGFECVPPGQSAGGGPCFMPLPCKRDGDCVAQGPNWICGPVMSACVVVNMGCTPGCTADADCGEAQLCHKDHHCAGRPCMSAADCPQEFVCAKATCARRTCQSDADCGAGYCVQGACFTGLGMCEVPPP
jgi:hypothetical protein